MMVTSAQNPLILEVRRAVAEGRPTKEGLIAAEGPHLLEEALASRWAIEHILLAERDIERHREALSRARPGVKVTCVGDRAFKSLCGTEENQGILSLLRAATFQWSDLLDQGGPVVVLDRIQDPGNAGTIFRSTEAFGGTGLVLARGTARVSNGKLLRAAAGSAFRVPYLEGQEPEAILAHLAASGRRMFALAEDGDRSIQECDLRAPFVLVVGNEGSGVAPVFREQCETVAIPTRRVESLNAAVACSIALFETSRQGGSATV